MKEFGFRAIPDDGNYRSSYSAHVPSADASEGPKEVETEPAAPSSRPDERLLESREPHDKGQEERGSWFGGNSGSSSSWIPWRKKPEVASPAESCCFKIV